MNDTMHAKLDAMRADRDAHRRLVLAMMARTQHHDACLPHDIGGMICGECERVEREEIAALAALPVGAT